MVAASFRASFPSIRLRLVVGVCGGVPQDAKTNAEILDAFISTGVIQFDFGRQYPDQVVRKDTLQDNLGRPNLGIRGFLNKIQGWRGRTQLSEQIVENITEIGGRPGFKPRIQHDHLYPATYGHKHHILENVKPAAFVSSTCCEMQKAVVRERIKELQANINGTEQSTMNPVLHFGLVASGDLVIKSAPRRDEPAARENVIGFEMEAAGVWDNFPTIIIKGVCDYADSHKDKKWQKYAAVTAPACT